MTRKVMQQAPVYQCQLANGNWIDQSKESYDYNNKMGQSVVRVLYAAIEQPVPPVYFAEHTWQHIANEWSDMATNGIQQIRNIKDGITTCDKALAGFDGDLKHCREVTAMAQPVPQAAYHGITPRPLDYPLSDYHEAPSSGPLHATWLDKPHRIVFVYDLVAALADIAQPVKMSVDHDLTIGTATYEDARRFADAIDPFVRKKAPDHLTMSCAAKTLRDLSQIVQTPSAIEQKQHSEPAEGQLPAIEFQNRVAPWMQVCFGPEISSDSMERNHRFFEESTELVQANGMTRSEAHQLVDYTFDRPVGELQQEIGGVMVTLAALCLAAGLDMHAAGETELARIWTKIEKIRKKQATKPKHLPIPEAPAISEISNTLLTNKLSKSLLIEDYGVSLDKSEWPEMLLKTSKLKPVSTGQGTHCCDETFLVDGCTVSVVYDYKDQAEPIEIMRYKAKPEGGKP